MLKLKNEIFSNGFLKSLGSLIQERLPQGTAWMLRKLYKELEKNLSIYEAARKGLIDKYAEKDKEGKPIIENKNYRIKDEKGFNKEFAELIAIEEKYDVDPVALPETVSISVADLVKLEDILKER